MILETAQLLYKETHTNNPCSVWARKNINNFSWLVDYFDSLAKEKYIRDQEKKPYHKSRRVLFEVFYSKKTEDYKI